jgi:hypothetical protein
VGCAEIRFAGYADTAFFAAHRFFIATLSAFRAAAENFGFGFGLAVISTAVFVAGADSPLIFAHLSF